MKNRVQVVVLENEELHQKLKFLTAEHKLREQTLLDASVSFYFFVALLSIIDLFFLKKRLCK